MKIVSIEPMEAFGSKVYFTQESVEGVTPRDGGEYHLRLSLEHETIKGKTEKIDFNLIMKVQGSTFQGENSHPVLNFLGKLILFIVAIAAVYMMLTACLKRREIEVLKEIPHEVSTTRLDDDF